MISGILVCFYQRRATRMFCCLRSCRKPKPARNAFEPGIWSYWGI